MRPGGQARADPPRDLRPDRPAADARGGRGVRARTTSPDAFAKVVDRLLASPHYGERWGRHWLDVARYAEDQAHTFGVKPNTDAWRYRDWVIDAFNDDMPYDRFVKLQLAGDLVPSDDRTARSTCRRSASSAWAPSTTRTPTPPRPSPTSWTTASIR